MVTKTIDWAYPTSPAAGKAGFSDTGCWVVRTKTERATSARTIAVYDNVHQAVKHALQLKAEWAPNFLKFGSAEVLALIAAEK